MASERDLELLDDYLSNRLSDADKVEFEQKLSSDPELSQELQHQQQVVEGIRQARAVELKTMLNNVPVSSIQGGQSSAFTAKLVTALLAAGLVSAAIYLYFNSGTIEETSVSENAQLDEHLQEGTATEEEALELVPDSSAKPEEESEPAVKPTEPVVAKPKSTTTAAERAEEAALQKERDLVDVISRTFVTSSTEVITEPGDDNRNFHYAFRNRKLVLFGSFPKNQYQILEFITDKEHIFFLSFNQNYYLLNDQQHTPTPLTPIKDPSLQKKLKEFRTH